MTILKSTSFGIAAAVVLASLAAPVSAGSLENMERERAIMIETMLSGDIDNTQRPPDAPCRTLCRSAHNFDVTKFGASFLSARSSE